jgi:hypothetical protein
MKIRKYLLFFLGTALAPIGAGYLWGLPGFYIVSVMMSILVWVIFAAKTVEMPLTNNKPTLIELLSVLSLFAIAGALYRTAGIIVIGLILIIAYLFGDKILKQKDEQ